MTIADLFAAPAGTTIRLGSADVAIGQVVTVDLHPSGSRFDGPAVIVSARNAQLTGEPLVRVISLADPTRRVVVKRLSDVI